MVRGLTVPHPRPKLCFLLLLGCISASSLTLQSKYFDFRGHPIHYQVASKEPSPSTPTSKPVLLLNGFGVGSFHQHKLIHELLKESEDDTIVYGVDYLGQGKSWPNDCDDGCSPSERGLSYSGETWVQQIISFMEAVVLNRGMSPTQRVHLVGNSVGGHLAVCVAAQRPDLVESVCLLNATPVWGLGLPGWNGRLPAPDICRRIGRAAFDWIRDVNTIEAYLKVAYHNEMAFDDELIQQIRSCTEGPGGHAAFASIMWSSPIKVKLPGGKEAFFDECLKELHCDVLLLFGRDDSWCKPAFAKRMMNTLSQRQSGVQRYIELANVGHCPNHEAPVAVASVLHRWVSADNRVPEALAITPDGPVEVRESWGTTTIVERAAEEIPLSLMDRLAITVV